MARGSHAVSMRGVSMATYSFSHRDEPPMNPLVFYDRLVGDGKAYIDTGFVQTGVNNLKEISFKGGFAVNPPAGAVDSDFLGTAFNTTSNNGKSIVRYYGGYIIARLNNQANRISVVGDIGNRAFTLDASFKYVNATTDHSKVIVNDVTKQDTDITFDGRSDSGTYPFHVFGHNSAGVNTNNKNGMYVEKVILEDSVSGRMMLFPCTFMGEAGLYDIINGVFYGNANSEGKFEVEGEGSAIPNMEGKATFGVISSDACFDTDIRKEEIASVEIMAEFKGLNGNGWRASPMLFGTRRSGGYDNWENCGFYPAVDDDNSPNWWYRGRKFKDNVLKYQLPINEPVIIRGGAEGFSVDSRKFNFADYATEEYVYRLVFERGISIGRLGLDNPKPWWSPAFKGSIYYFKIFDEDGKLTHQLVAKQEEGNRAYLYDEITKKEYHSVGGAVQFESIR